MAFTKMKRLREIFGRNQEFCFEMGCDMESEIQDRGLSGNMKMGMVCRWMVFKVGCLHVIN